MSARDTILAALRANRPAIDAPAPTVPAFDDGAHEAESQVERFVAALESLGGAWCEPAAGQSPEAAMRSALGARLGDSSVIVSNTPEIPGNRPLSPDDDPRDIHDVDVAVLRARFGVAETGSVCFTEAELIINAVAYLAQHLVVLLDPAEIVTNLHRAYQRDDYNNAAYTVFHTGPSATADIEGVLVRGAQGVRSLTVMPTTAST